MAAILSRPQFVNGFHEVLYVLFTPQFHIRRVHDQEKNHPCEQCDYSAFDKPNLQQHMFAKHGVALPDHVVR